ncbi:hypothetical protein PR048_004193 [Dryococelus australis]|uniref:Uncharacterized protein n=1 Tax=Dryococelus australis TaxID=614101 RepID=A0ABQ9I4X5_9NEOP|nr:hypothetical protein PR048_004193 [Dryococelus australis]
MWPVYRLFFQVHLPTLLEEVPLRIRETMWYQHNGALAHFSNPVYAVIANTYGHRWIGRGGPVNWPARSQDFTPLDVFLKGDMEALVYLTSVDS